MTGQIKLITENLAKWLDLNGWNRQQFAEALKVSPEFVSMLMNGKRLPSLSTLEDICNVTGLEPGRLITYDRGADNGKDESGA